MSRELALQVRDLNVWYRPGGVIRRSRLVPVLHDISFDLWRGEALGLVGESGSGKSTLARTILGMVPDYTGTVTHFTKRPQMIFQDPYSSLNPSRTVGWILSEPLKIYGKYDARERERRVRETIGLSACRRRATTCSPRTSLADSASASASPRRSSRSPHLSSRTRPSRRSM